MNRPHEGVCTCPACCPGKWDANRIAAQRMAAAGQLPPPSMAVWPQTIDFRLEQVIARIDMLEAIIRAHVRLTDSSDLAHCDDK